MARIIKVKDHWYKIRIKKGLDLKIDGSPEQKIAASPQIKRVALLGDDYPGMKPSLLVSVGDTVKLGQQLFTDSKRPAIKFTSPGSGKVVEINRGDKRKFESIVIELSGEGEVVFPKLSPQEIQKISRDDVVSQLLDSGLWTSIRNRPFGYVADPHVLPHSVFITAIDTQPHAPRPDLFLEKYSAAFETGLEIIKKITRGNVYLAFREGGKLIPYASENASENLVHVEVNGPHPAGNVGTLIHFFDPIGPGKNVFYLDYQDLAAIGHFFQTGKILTERLISIAGPASLNPSLVFARLGASASELVAGRKKDGEVRVVSGSLLSGNTAVGTQDYLGRYHRQISLIHENRERKLLGWLSPGWRTFSLRRVFLSSFLKPKHYEFTTSTNGSKRAIIPIGMFEDVMPMDINPTYLLRTILMGDIEYAEELGVLELEEEDLALCSFVSPGKEDFGAVLRTILERMAKGE